MGRGTPCNPCGGSGSGNSMAAVSRSVAPTVVIGMSVNGRKQPDTTRPTGTPAGGGNSSDTKIFPNFSVLGLTPADQLIREIYVEETVGFELPYARISLANLDSTQSSTEKAKEQSKFTVTMGYKEGIRNHGTYYVQRPKFVYPRQGALRVDIIGYGEAVKMGDTERREVYKKMKDSEIASKIAQRNGFSADVEKTDLTHEQVIQANESDYKFLARRAKLYGYVLYVVDGVMHFHQPKPRESGMKLAYFTTQGNLYQFTARSRTFLWGCKLKWTQIDPLRKQDIKEESTEQPDPVQAACGPVNWKDLVDLVGQPEMFVTNEGHEQERSLAKTQVDRMARATRYVIAGDGEMGGAEELRPNDLITISGIGRSSGKYYVTKTIHHLTGGLMDGNQGYRTSFEVVRAGAGELVANNVTTPESAGMARM